MFFERKIVNLHLPASQTSLQPLYHTGLFCPCGRRKMPIDPVQRMPERNEGGVDHSHQFRTHSASPGHISDAIDIYCQWLLKFQPQRTLDISSHLDPSVNSTARYVEKWFRPLQRGTLSALLSVVRDTLGCREGRCVHPVNLHACFPAQRLDAHVEAVP